MPATTAAAARSGLNEKGRRGPAPFALQRQSVQSLAPSFALGGKSQVPLPWLLVANAAVGAAPFWLWATALGICCTGNWGTTPGSSVNQVLATASPSLAKLEPTPKPEHGGGGKNHGLHRSSPHIRARHHGGSIRPIVRGD